MIIIIEIKLIKYKFLGIKCILSRKERNILLNCVYIYIYIYIYILLLILFIQSHPQLSLSVSTRHKLTNFHAGSPLSDPRKRE